MLRIATSAIPSNTDSVDPTNLEHIWWDGANGKNHKVLQKHSEIRRFV